MRLLIDTLAQEKESEYILAVTGDHSTPVRYGDHSHEPVPIAFGLASKIKEKLDSDTESNLRFNELICGGPQANRGRFNGNQIMTLLKNYRESLL